MMVRDPQPAHDQVWLLLPWLANGRLSAAERELAEQHLRHCEECERELALQRLICGAFTEPDRVSYAPGPSFRKLMDRIDQEAAAAPAVTRGRLAKRRSADRWSAVSPWQPPGLAWAASFLLLFGVAVMVAAAYRWSEPVYRTHTEVPEVTPNVLHIALDRSLTLGEVEELLRINGARIVEGPGSTGIFGVTPAGVAPGQASGPSVERELRALSARLRSNPRVLWVQPLAADTDRRVPDSRGR